MAGHWIIWDLIENLAAFFWFRQWTGFWFLPCYEWIHLKYFVYQKVWKSNVLLWYLVCCVVYYIICRVYTNCGKTIPKLNKKEARPIYMLVLTITQKFFMVLTKSNLFHCDFAGYVAGIYCPNFSFNPHRLGTQPDLQLNLETQKLSFLIQRKFYNFINAFSLSNFLFSIKGK